MEYSIIPRTETVFGEEDSKEFEEPEKKEMYIYLIRPQPNLVAA